MGSGEGMVREGEERGGPPATYHVHQIVGEQDRGVVFLLCVHSGALVTSFVLWVIHSTFQSIE